MKAVRIPRPCKQCGDVFTPRKVGNGWTQFCSTSCSGEARKKPDVSATCPVCSKVFTYRPSKKRKHCSRSCASLARPAEQVERAIRASLESRSRRRVLLDASLPGSLRLVCARPGCTSALTGQSWKYCSPPCHYLDRHRTGARRSVQVHVCAACGEQFNWNGKGTGAACSLACSRSFGSKPIPVTVVDEVVLRGFRRAEFKDSASSCRGCGGRVDHQHHVVFAQHVLRADGDKWDPANALALCRECHYSRAHALRFPVTALRDENFEFAARTLGPGAAFEYFNRRYVGHDQRLDALKESHDRHAAA